MEQNSNVLALERLGLADTMHELDEKTIAAWLEKAPGTRILYPDTATAIARWVVRGDWSAESAQVLARGLWRQTRGLAHLPPLPQSPLV